MEADAGSWPDYVFEQGYELGSLKSLQQYVKTHKHLPGIPAAREVGQQGVDLGKLTESLLKKVEELTLHLIAKEDELERLTEKDAQRQQQFDALLKRVMVLEQQNKSKK